MSTKAGVLLEKLGIKAIALHGRTSTQLYKGKANWDYIKELKESVNIPVIGNGDVLNYADFNNMREYTKCDAVMIGRGALGNPWVFSNILDEIFSEDYKINNLDTVKTCIGYIKLLIENKAEKFQWVFQKNIYHGI